MPPSPNEISSEGLLVKKTGRIRLVGAGPGDPGLLTIKALRAIQEADLIVSDNLVPQAILDLIPNTLTETGNKRLYLAPKKRQPSGVAAARTGGGSGGKADESQEELMNVALNALNQGLEVVRLKNGDPFVFGRGGEEILFFRSHGYEAEVIPGISSSLCAPLYGLIPVTHRGLADQFLVTTAQGRNGAIPEIPPYCDHRTTIFLMGVSRMADLVADLVKNGYPEDCPVAVVEKASHPDQRVFRGNFKNIVEIAQREQIQSPSTIIVGLAVNALL